MSVLKEGREAPMWVPGKGTVDSGTSKGTGPRGGQCPGVERERKRGVRDGMREEGAGDREW